MPSLLSYSVVKEPAIAERAARLPDPLVRVKRHAFESPFARDANSFRLMRTRVFPLRCETGKDRTTRTALQELRILGAARAAVNHFADCLAIGTTITAWSPFVFPGLTSRRKFFCA